MKWHWIHLCWLCSSISALFLQPVTHPIEEIMNALTVYIYILWILMLVNMERGFSLPFKCVFERRDGGKGRWTVSWYLGGGLDLLFLVQSKRFRGVVLIFCLRSMQVVLDMQAIVGILRGEMDGKEGVVLDLWWIKVSFWYH